MMIEFFIPMKLPSITLQEQKIASVTVETFGETYQEPEKA